MARTLGGSSTASFVKHLASCNKPTRDKALRLLKTWLPSQTQVSSSDMKKIWKGLFYCVWHSDKQQVQLELINRLSSLLVSLADLSLSIQYFEGFVLMIRREWSGIDYLRLDKFYLLIRRFLFNLFLLLKKNDWDLVLVNRFMRVLEEKSLLSSDRFPAQGVNYHVCEIFLEELKKFLPVRLEVVEALLKPFLLVLGKSLDKVLLNKIKTSMFDCLLKDGRKLLEMKKIGDENGSAGSSGSGVPNEFEVLGTLALKLGLSTKFFDLGSSEDCVQGNRKVLFGLHEEWGKLEKDLASSGIEIEISIPQVSENDDMDEASELIPITLSEVGNGSTGNSSKKKKKGRKAKVLEEQMGVDQQVANGSAESSSQKSKKAKKTKSSKMKNKDVVSDSVVSEVEDKSENENVANGENSTDNGGLITFNESVISNLTMQFEKVAAEVGMEPADTSIDDESPVALVNGTVSKKRKRARSIAGKVSVGASPVAGGIAVGKSGEKSAKKVRFSMKNNLVWKPHSPLPPQSLRLPPSATPRGSALKKGLSPGPIMDTPVVMKKAKRRATSVKKLRKGLKSVSPSVKRLKKLRPASV